MQALPPKAGHNTIVPLANRKPEHFCDLTICKPSLGSSQQLRCLNCNQVGHFARDALGKFIAQFALAGETIQLIVPAIFVLDSSFTRQTFQFAQDLKRTL